MPLLLSIFLWPYLATTDDSNTYVNPIHMPLTDRVIFILFCGTLVVQFFAKALSLFLLLDVICVS